MNWEAWARDLFKPGKKSFAERTLLTLLAPVEKTYSFLLNMAGSFYETGHMKRHKLEGFTLSVGNITAGGTGKTPFVRYLATVLQERGVKVAILSRGYRGMREKEGGIVSDGKRLLLSAAEAGDEPFLLAQSLPGAIVAVGKRRSRIGREVEEKYAPQVFLLDDGFQHWKLRRDIDIVLIDATNPFSNGYVLPRGLLREPLDHLERADVFVVTKTESVSQQMLDDILAVLQSYRVHVPVLLTEHRPGPVLSWDAWRNKKRFTLRPPQRVVTLCALGNPESFATTVRAAGLNPVEEIRLPDHHLYTATDLAAARKIMRDCGAEAIVVSEKDAVKITEFVTEEAADIYVQVLDFHIRSGAEEFWDYVNDEWGLRDEYRLHHPRQVRIDTPAGKTAD
ncbi:MAG: tetraacyldisaccharide 4'-kinase [Veillonellaceae bacterium]|nr:tetraacyldisaccharide 4'-kinase [Veillonellaceae bacterium]